MQIGGGGVQVGRDQTVHGDLVLGDKIGGRSTCRRIYVEAIIINPETPPEDLLRAYYRAWPPTAGACRWV